MLNYANTDNIPTNTHGRTDVELYSTQKQKHCISYLYYYRLYIDVFIGQT